MPIPNADSVKQAFAEYQESVKKHNALRGNYYLNRGQSLVKSIMEHALKANKPPQDIINMIHMHQDHLVADTKALQAKIALLNQYSEKFAQGERQRGHKRSKSIIIFCANADKAENILDIFTVLKQVNEDPLDYNFFVCNRAPYNKSALYEHIIPEKNIMQEFFKNEHMAFKGAPYDVILFQYCPPISAAKHLIMHPFYASTARTVLKKLKAGGKLIIQSPEVNKSKLELCGEEFLSVIEQEAWAGAKSQCICDRFTYIWQKSNVIKRPVVSRRASQKKISRRRSR